MRPRAGARRAGKSGRAPEREPFRLAAHARVLYESLTQEKGAAQVLMVPIEVELARGEEEKAEKLNEIGIECRILKRMLVVDALPPFLDAANFGDFFANFKEGKEVKQLATRFVRSSKKSYLVEEARMIWQKAKNSSDPLYDPLGNRIYVNLNEEDFTRLMGKHG